MEPDLLFDHVITATRIDNHGRAKLIQSTMSTYWKASADMLLAILAASVPLRVLYARSSDIS